MGPRTGPRPASSTPRQHGGAVEGSDGFVGRSEDGIGEKWAFEAPARRGSWWIDGGMYVRDVSISSVGWESAMMKLWRGV